MKKVYIIQRVLTHYRVAFFNQLRAELAQSDIQLHLLYGCGNADDEKRGYLATLPWGQQVKETYLKIGKSHAVWQQYEQYLKEANLVVVVQEMKLLLNHWLFLKKNFNRFKLAYWGHSVNLQEDRNSLKNRVKRGLNNWADWWFVYTQGEKKIVEAGGFPGDKITIVQNSIDTKYLLTVKDRIKPQATEKIRKDLGIRQGQPVGLYCGGMYKEKRLDFLLEACQRIKKELPDFHMIFIGGGPMENVIRALAPNYSWIHYLGPIYDEVERVKYFAISDVLLCPGLVGLAILDSLALEVPVMATDYPFHSPEIEYLENKVNGLMTSDNMDDYCRHVIEVLKNKNYLNVLKQGCRTTSGKYSAEQMAINFAQGIRQCIVKN